MKYFSSLDFQVRNTCYTQLKRNTNRIKYLEKGVGCGETAAFQEKEGSQHEKCTAWGQISVLDKLFIIWEDDSNQEKKWKRKQNKAHDKAEKHLLWYPGNDRNILPHESSIKDELDVSF